MFTEKSNNYSVIIPTTIDENLIMNSTHNNHQLCIGDYNTLSVLKISDIGAFLDAGNPNEGGWGEVLLPARYVPEHCAEGDTLNVFLYFDSEDRLIATTETPKAKVGEFAFLQVVDVNQAGAFLDWGLPKDVLAPYVEQSKPMRQGAFYVVYLYQDEESERITASSKLSKFLDKTPKPYRVGECVKGLVMAKTDLGYKVIINHCHTGILYANEVFSPLKIGQAVEVQIKKIRDDDKIDLLLPQPKKSDLSELEQTILERLKANHGILSLGDKTPPDAIYRTLGVSKKNFKRAISRLYKARLIVIEAERIRLA